MYRIDPRASCNELAQSQYGRSKYFRIFTYTYERYKESTEKRTLAVHPKKTGWMVLEHRTPDNSLSAEMALDESNFRIGELKN